MKHKRFIRALSILLTLVMAFGAAPLSGVSVLAAETVDSGTCGDNLTWTLDSDGLLTISGTGDMDNWNWEGNASPWKDNTDINCVVIEPGVSSIGSYAFYFCRNLTSVTIPEGVTSIGTTAFGYTSVTELTIPSTVTEYQLDRCYHLETVRFAPGTTVIPRGALYASPVKNVYFPDTVTEIKEEAFTACESLTSITLPASLKKIGNSAFRATGLTEIVIPDGVEEIGWYAFGSPLKSIELPTSITKLDTNDTSGFLENSESDIFYKGTLDQWNAIDKGSYPYNCVRGILHTSYIPGETNHVLGQGAIGDNLSWVITDDLALTITGEGQMIDYGYGTEQPFREWRGKIQTLVLEEGLTSIGIGAFQNCTALSEVTLPSTVTSVGDAAFRACTSLETVNLNEGLVSIGSSAFYNDQNLSAAALPSSLASLGESAFYSTGISSITIPENVTVIPNDLFRGCQKLESVTFLGDVTSIGDSAFHSASALTRIDLPDSLTEISEAAFRHTGLLSVEIPEGVASLPNTTFDHCSNLRYAVIPCSVTSISYAQFSYTALTDIYYQGSEEQWNQIRLDTGYNDAIVNATIHYNHELGSHIHFPGETVTQTESVRGCETDGVWYEKVYCTECGELISSTRHFEAAYGHDWGEGEISLAPTALTAGVRTYTCANCGETKTEAIPADSSLWADDETVGMATFSVVNAQSLAAVSGAKISVSTADFGTLTAYTGSDGAAAMALPVGKQSVTVSYDGCIERSLKINIEHKINEIPVIGLSDQPTVDARLTVTPMTYAQIVEAGISVEDPENYNVEKYTATFVYEGLVTPSSPSQGGDDPGSGSGTPVPQTVVVETEYIVDEDTGATYVPDGTGGWVKGGCIYVPDFGGAPAKVYVSDKFCLVVSGDVKWLKEMFDVKMFIWNNSRTDTLENLDATLVLPEGLSLAAMNEGEQSATQHIDAIAEGGSAVAQWYIRGDEAGKYQLTATLDGVTMPFEEQFHYTYESDDTLTVYGANALKLSFTVPETYVCGNDLPVKITLTNISDKTLYNVQHIITDIKAFKLSQYKENILVHVKQAGEEYYPYAFDSEMAPGDSFDIEFSVSLDTSKLYANIYKLVGFVVDSDIVAELILNDFGYNESHTFGEWVIVAQAQGCVSGLKKRVCANCGAEEEEIIPADGTHTPGEAVETVIEPATCGKAGKKKVVVKCAVCDEIISETVEAIPPTGEHTFTWVVDAAATCGKAGVKHEECTACHAKRSENTTIPATSHDWGAWTLINAPTCTEEGLEQRVCANDGSHVETRPVEKLAHEDLDEDGYCDDCHAELDADGTEHKSNCVCGKYHTGPFAGLIKFFHKIIYFFKNLFSKN